MEWASAESLRLGEDDDDEEPEYVQFKADIPVHLGNFLGLNAGRIVMHLDPKKFEFHSRTMRNLELFLPSLGRRSTVSFQVGSSALE